MTTIEINCIQEVVEYLLTGLAENGLKEATINVYRKVYSHFCKYLYEAGIEIVTEEVCLDYLEPLMGKRLSGLHERLCNCSNHWRVSPLYLMLNYQNEGLSCHSSRRKNPVFICPDECQEEYAAYISHLDDRAISPTSIKDRTRRVQHFIRFQSFDGNMPADQLTARNIDSYLLQYKDNAIKYRAKVVSDLKDYFAFLYLSGYTDVDLRKYLPKLHIPRSSGIPHVWTKEELASVLAVVDREDPTGKRNYAIFLLTIYTGLRAGDIRNLRLSDIDWENKAIHIIMGKTGQPLDLPLSDEVGWSIIDYLKNGRPLTTSDHVFVKHNAPIGPIGGTAALDNALARCILKAGITVNPKEHYGMHSLRNTLAKNMLLAGAPLSIVTQTLGHEDPRTTEIYLKTNLDDLRRCAIDPDEETEEL